MIKKKIVYICHAEKGPSGGAKIIYDHCEIINNLKGFSSSVAHIKKKKTSKWNNSISKILGKKKKYFGWQFKDIEVKKNFKFPWFNSKITIANSLNFNSDDFIIFPEIFSHLAKEICIKKKIPYAIFVQNGYTLQSTNNIKLLNEVYSKSKFILSYSKDITNCVVNYFPDLKRKILKINCSVSTKHNNSSLKKNIITYMPRKLPDHSSKLLFFLQRRLNKKWKIISLHNLKQSEVYAKLASSKIFLSFSSFEGLGLPPIEAAILGNKVIGYTGEGGSDYWKKPIFTEIKTGSIINFLNEILKETKRKNFFTSSKKQRNKLQKMYSKNEEKKYIKKFLKKIN